MDWNDKSALSRAAKNCGVGRSRWAALGHFAKLMSATHFTRDIITARCERGAQIAHNLGFPAETSEAIQSVDEQWCGKGHPVGMRKEEIPLLSRILLISQTVEAFWNEHGLAAAIDMLQKRRGRWFDPALVDVVKSWRRDTSWWTSITELDHIEDRVLALEPGSTPMLATDERLDRIAYAFASVIDAKTPFTYRHSTNVAGYAAAISSELGYDRVISRDILRAGLLHDIGKFGISNRILDKPGPLTDAERNEMQKHPAWTWEILERVPAFHRFALPASLHHERLDGTGYPWGIPAEGLDFAARILGIADVYEALTAERPYRGSMDPVKALAIMNKDAGTAFDPAMMEIATSLALDGTLARIADGSDDPLVMLAGQQLGTSGDMQLSASNSFRVA